MIVLPAIMASIGAAELQGRMRPSSVRIPSVMFRLLLIEVRPVVPFDVSSNSSVFLNGLSIYDAQDGT